MKTFSTYLLSELDLQLETIHSATDVPILYSERALQALLPAMDRLKSFILSYSFQSPEEEIDFFKRIKPQIASKLIYYNEIYNIEMGRPQGGDKALRKFLQLELDKLRRFFNENQSFYRYHRTGSTYLDHAYYLRMEPNISMTLDSIYFQADQRFSTAQDFKTSVIIANELVQAYLEASLLKLENKQAPSPAQPQALQWTSSKVALVELIYALHSEGAFNQGATSLNEVAHFFEAIFNIELGQYNRAYIEMRLRKSDRTKFLNSLRERLLRRMDDADG